MFVIPMPPALRGRARRARKTCWYGASGEAVKG